MHKLFHLSVILALLLALVPANAAAHTEDDPMVVDLLAGQTMDIGDLKVWNDEDNLYVQYLSDICMLETHLHVATALEDIPQKNGNPIPGLFDYATYHGCAFTYTYVIPLGDWEVDTVLFIAAHVELGQEEAMVIFSNGDAATYVTAGNVPLATYPYLAVDSWEPPNDPLDPTPSGWDAALSYLGNPFTFTEPADWIWESYRVGDPLATQYVTFNHTFTVPGYPLAGRLYIAADDTYQASLNSAFVGEHMIIGPWSEVGGYDIFPVEGDNRLQVIASNYGFVWGTPDNNPAGLIYQAEITYLIPGETAWGAGEMFPGKNWATYFTYTVQESVIPTPGEDIVVFNDINPFDNGGMANPNNPLMVANLVNYVNLNPRGTGTVVWFDRGRNSKCNSTGECNDGNLATMRDVITAAGYSITNIYSTSGSITSIPADVKVVFLWNPLIPYTTDEINVFKQFADEGGRLVFIGEWDGYYGSGIALENQFLLDMGAVMTNIGMAVDCGYHDLPGTSLRPHQITTGMTGVRIACASVIVPGPDDYPFLYDTTNTLVLAGVAKIDTTPLPLTLEMQVESLPVLDLEEEVLNPESSTGH